MTGEDLRLLMEKAGVGPTALAREMGVTDWWIRLWRRGELPIPDDVPAAVERIRTGTQLKASDRSNRRKRSDIREPRVTVIEVRGHSERLVLLSNGRFGRTR